MSPYGKGRPRKGVSPKVAASSVAGAGALVLVFIAEQFGVDVPPEVASAVTALLAAAAGWLKPETSNPGGS